MTTQIIFDFDSMDDETAGTIAAGIEGFINRQFTHSGFHGSIYRTEVSPWDSESASNSDDDGWIQEQEARKNPQILEPGYVEVGDGVTWGYASDSYAGTITRTSKSQVTIYFTRDDDRLVSGGIYEGHQTYEYKPNPNGHEHMARWNHKAKRYVMSSRYRVSPGRHAYRSPSV